MANLTAAQFIKKLEALASPDGSFSHERYFKVTDGPKIYIFWRIG